MGKLTKYAFPCLLWAENLEFLLCPFVPLLLGSMFIRQSLPVAFFILLMLRLDLELYWMLCAFTRSRDSFVNMAAGANDEV